MPGRPPPINEHLPPQALMHAKADKVKAVAQGTTFPMTKATRFGEVQFEALLIKTDPQGNEYLDVRLRGDTQGGDPHFRIWNPPLLVEDPLGDIELGGRKFREDPLGAVAEAIARHGGRRKGPRPA